MKHANLKSLSYPAAALTFATIALTSASAQTAKPKMTTDIPPEITTPDTVETQLGTLKFFDVDDLASFRTRVPVDAAVGRFILMYLREPAAILSHFARQVRPGGLIVFQELVFSMCRSEPSCPLLEKCRGWVHDTFTHSGADVEMGWKLSSTFERAGLPSPEMFLGSPVGAGRNSPMYRYIADTVRSLLPMMEHYGVASAEEVMVDNLADRLRIEMTAAGTVCATPCTIGAWIRKLDDFNMTQQGQDHINT